MFTLNPVIRVGGGYRKLSWKVNVLYEPSSHPKKYLPNFPTQKKSRNQTFQTLKNLRSSPSLEIWSIPLGIYFLRYHFTQFLVRSRVRLRSFAVNQCTNDAFIPLKDNYNVVPS